MRTVNPEKHALKRAEILRAAAAEFAEAGLDGTSTAKICKRAGIGSGTLFHYFRTKRAIFLAVFADALERDARLRTEALAAPDGLGLLIDHVVAELADPTTPGLAAAALLQANRDLEFAEMLATADTQLIETLTTLLADREPPFPAERSARWIQRVIDAAYLSAGDPDFDPPAEGAELRRIVNWLTGDRDPLAK